MESKTLKALQDLAVKLGCCAKSADATGDTVDEVINYISKNMKGSGKYSNHLQYNLQLTGTWSEDNKTLTYDETTKTNVAVVLNKLEELCASENYDFLVNVKVVLADSDASVVALNQKATFVPSSGGVYPNIQFVLISNATTPEFNTVAIADEFFKANDTIFKTSLTFATIVIDINY